MHTPSDSTSDIKINKNFILTNLLNKSGGFNYKKAKSYGLTPEDAYNIVNPNSNSCICGELLTFINFKMGYRKSCGNKKCKINKTHKVNDIVITKKFIQENLFKSDGSFNGIKAKKYSSSQICYNVYHSIDTPICEFCNKPKKFISFNEGYLKSCGSKKCGYLAQAKSIDNRSSDKLEDIKLKKRLRSNLIKSKKIIQKLKYLTLKRKLRETQIQKYGFNLTEKIKNHTSISSEIWREKFISGCIFNEKSCMEYHDMSISYVNSIKSHLGILEKNTPYIVSKPEIVLRKIVPNGLFNRKDKIGQELDLLCEEYNFAIEFNGVLWHSFGTTFPNNSHKEKKNKNKHLIKTELCEAQGIQLFHICELEWNNNIKKQIWISMIRGKMNLHKRIYARKTKIREVSVKDAREFLEENHMQGYSNSSYRIGLYEGNNLVSIMTFGKPRFDKIYEYELIRFASKKHITVVGGGSKLLKYFIENNQPKSLLSYADRRWSVGNFYEKVGFKFVGNTKIGFSYYKDGKISHRMKFQKHKLKDKLNIYDENKSTSENIFNDGYRKIYNSGNKKYVWVR